jgi:hypothetical protein
MKAFLKRFDPQSPDFHRRWIITLVLLSLFSGAFFFLCMLYGTEGHLSAPLDDTFIFFQYARQNAQGDFFRYNTGDLPSTGATSFLYLWIVTLGYLVGFTDIYLVLFSYALGIIFLFFTALGLYLLGKGLWGPGVGAGASLSLVFYGPLLWGFFAGMDLGLFVAVLIYTAYFYHRESIKGRPLYLTTLFSTLLVLTRPEGLLLSLVLFFFAGGAFSKNKEKKNWLLLFPLGAGLGLGGLNYLLTGSFSPTSLKSKSPLFILPFDPLNAFQRSATFYLYFLKDLLGGLIGHRSPKFNANIGETLAFLPPLAFLFFLLGFFHYRKENKNSRILGLIFAWFFVGTLAVAVGLPVHFHWNRYLLPYLAFFILVTFGGFDFLAQKLAPKEQGNSASLLRGGFFLYFFIFSLASFFYFGAAYGKNCQDIYFQQITLGRWINQHLPASASIVVNDAGALRYFGQRRIIDYFGLTTTEIVNKKIKGPGSIFEYLRHREKPSHSAVHTIFFDPANWGLNAQLLYSAQLLTPTISGGDNSPINLYKLSWEESPKGDLPALAAVKEKLKTQLLIDQIDTAYTEEERAHGYRAYSVEAGKDGTLIHRNGYAGNPKLSVIDGGRLISGGEYMIIKVPQTKAVTMVLRTDEPFELKVEVNGRPVGTWSNPVNLGGLWMEEIFILPGDAIKAGENVIHIQNLARHRNLYFSYHYWFYQEKP